MPNLTTTDASEKRISLVYDATPVDTISNFTVSGTNGTALQANADREELFIQNMSTSHLHVKYGTFASSNSFNLVLASSTNAGGGDGGSLSDLNYTGIVSVSGVSPNYICWERS
jgi:hypothetical protein